VTLIALTRSTCELETELGHEARTSVPRQAHGGWKRRDDGNRAVELLVDQDRHRSPALVPIRHGRMSLSPFAFFRGAAVVMADDLASVRRRACAPSSAVTPT
jgi:hypothetical protein